MSDYDNSPERQEIFETRNAGYNNATVIQLRLDTQPIIEAIEQTLRGSIIKPVQDSDGNISYQEYRVIPKPRCNSEGQQAIVQYCQNVVNSQTVQGNFEDREVYNYYMAQVRKDLADMVTKNQHKWEIDTKDYGFILNSIMNLIEPFMSRLIKNLERESYAATIRHSENNTIGQKPNGFWSNINPFRRSG